MRIIVHDLLYLVIHMKKNIAILLFIVLIEGCTSGLSVVHNADDFVVVDLSHITDKTNRAIDEIVDSVQIIKLQTTDESLLSSSLKIEISDKYIYVLDYRFGTVKIFTRDGFFFKNIAIGMGPGEINAPSIIRYVKNEEKLYICQDHLINCYSADGKFLKDYHIPFFVDDFIKQGENFVCFQYARRAITHQTTIVEIDPNMKVISTFILEKERLIYGTNNLSINYKGDINFFRPLDNNIYTYKDEEILLSKQLDFGCRDYDLKSLKSEIDYQGFNNYAIDHPEIFTLSDFYTETADYEMYRIGRGALLNFTTVFRNKKNGEIVETALSAMRKTNIINNLIYIGAYEDYFVAYCPLFKIAGILDVAVENERTIPSDDIKIFKNMSDEDNPILVLIKLKAN